MIEDICTNLSLGFTRLEPRGGRRIPVRLRESRRAALVALVGSGWENSRYWVAHVYIIPAERILSS